jgi:fructan beta-fructosidase
MRRSKYFLQISCAIAMWATLAQAQTLYHERYRPQFHFTPTKGWMNDPNGLVYFDGEYHLFFQYLPDALTVQTPIMSWGHAVSSDLIHWTQLPIALSPDAHDGWIRMTGTFISSPKARRLT